MRDGMPTSHVMGHTPYVEASVGIYNIFKLLHIEYVRRLTYTDIPGVKKGGVRFMILMIFLAIYATIGRTSQTEDIRRIHRSETLGRTGSGAPQDD